MLTAAVLDVALRIIRDLDDVRALSGALAGDLTARANSDGEVVDLMHAHAHAIVLTYAHALGLARADAVTRTCAADPDLIRTIGLTPARALADAIAVDLAGAIALARASAVELADAIDLDLNILSAFDFDLARVLELARVHAASLDRAYALARGIPRAADLDLAGVFGLPSVHPLDPALPLPGVLGLPLRWVAGGPLAGTLLPVLAAGPPAGRADRPLPADPYEAFALALCSRAGIQETARLRAALGGPLSDALRELAAAGPASDWNQPTGLGRLTDGCAPLSTTHRSPGPPEAAALRAVALALADGARRAWSRCPARPAYRRRHGHADREPGEGRGHGRRVRRPRPGLAEPVPGMWSIRPRGEGIAPIVLGGGEFTQDFGLGRRPTRPR